MGTWLHVSIILVQILRCHWTDSQTTLLFVHAFLYSEDLQAAKVSITGWPRVTPWRLTPGQAATSTVLTPKQPLQHQIACRRGCRVEAGCRMLCLCWTPAIHFEACSPVGNADQALLQHQMGSSPELLAWSRRDSLRCLTWQP